ncbi:MAG TPA: phosphate ABC transporter substrate-binding/OmpA family protein [Candidatus Saccharimonadales bacterium]|nr:phosphate ABC transporter substrate-binding/OmpA family protein [Candidatus Saccharimonadales bacterium]
MTGRGKLALTLLILCVVALGFFRWRDQLSRGLGAAGGGTNSSATPEETPAELVETQAEVPSLPAPIAYVPKDNTVDLELSEYAGYAGLIVANGGLEPSTNSLFFKQHGFKVRIKLSEEESWPALNSGKMAGSATTVDVLAVYGKQFQVVVPAQIGFSRGADGVVVRSEVKRINALKGRILTASQFTEAEFFIRYLAQEAGLPIRTLPDLKAAPAADSLNLVFCKDAFAAGDFFLRDLQSGRNRLAGCVTWAPKTTEVARQSGGKAHVLTTSLNLLVIADVLVLNKGFAEQQTNLVAGLVHGLLEGNRLVREQPPAFLELIGKTFKWEREQTLAELAKVHLSNLPENLAFFSGSIDAAGSFGGIYQSAVYAYGPQIIRDPVDADRFADVRWLRALEQSGAYRDQQVAIKPIRAGSAAAVEGDPILSKDIRFLFEANSATLDLSSAENLKNLEVIQKLLQVSPGSVVLLRGHVDNGKVEEFRKTGGEAYVRTMALRAVELSKNRAAEIKRVLIERHHLEPGRLDVMGRGWEEPLGTDGDKNRRVEVQWFMIE